MFHKKESKNLNISEYFPLQEKEFSGQLRLRLPKALHKQLAQSAAEEGVSLNMLIVYLVSANHARRRSLRNAVECHYAHKVEITLTTVHNVKCSNKDMNMVDFFGEPSLWEVW
jgi:hypothetical protein